MNYIQYERFLNKIFIESTDSCWLWQGAIGKDGYGIVKLSGRTITAHRAAFIHFNGGIPNNTQVLHRCDVRNCVKKEHLFLGTQADNLNDAIQKGRRPEKGLTDEQVREARWKLTHGYTPYELESVFPVTRTVLRRIKEGNAYKEVV